MRLNVSLVSLDEVVDYVIVVLVEGCVFLV